MNFAFFNFFFFLDSHKTTQARRDLLQCLPQCTVTSTGPKKKLFTDDIICAEHFSGPVQLDEKESPEEQRAPNMFL